nr:MAG TPA: hypothetical protein [Caudoviricetes sp.]
MFFYTLYFTFFIFTLELVHNQNIRKSIINSY